VTWRKTAHGLLDNRTL